MVKIEDILFWILIALIVGIALWKLFGSPTDIATLVSVSLFFAGSEILLWRALYSIDKKTIISFMRINNDINNLRVELSGKIENIHKNLENIENLIKRRK